MPLEAPVTRATVPERTASAAIPGAYDTGSLGPSGRLDAMQPSESQRKQHALEMFEQLPARYDEIATVLSFFQDPRWRRYRYRGGDR